MKLPRSAVIIVATAAMILSASALTIAGPAQDRVASRDTTSDVPVALSDSVSPAVDPANGYQPLDNDAVLMDTKSLGLTRIGYDNTLRVNTSSDVPVGAVAVAATISLSELASDWGYASTYACESSSSSAPNTSVATITSRADLAWSGVIALSSDGAFCVYLYNLAHVEVTVHGYFAADAGFVPVGPRRPYDSRNSSYSQGSSGPLNPSETRTIDVIDSSTTTTTTAPPTTTTASTIPTTTEASTSTTVSTTTTVAHTSALNVTQTDSGGEPVAAHLIASVIPSGPGTITFTDCTDTSSGTAFDFESTSVKSAHLRIPVASSGEICATSTTVTHLIVDLWAYETSDTGYRLPSSLASLDIETSTTDDGAQFEVTWEPPALRQNDVTGYVVTASGTSGCAVDTAARTCTIDIASPPLQPGQSTTVTTHITTRATGQAGLGPAHLHTDTRTFRSPGLAPQVKDFDLISTGATYGTLVAEVDPGGTYTVVELTCTPTGGGLPRVTTNAKGGSGWQTEVLGCSDLLEGREHTAQMRVYNESGEVRTPILTFTTDPAIGFTINEGAAYTRTGDVTLTFVPGDAVEALVANDGSFTDATVVDPTEPLAWSLSTPQVSGTRVVYVKLINENGGRIGTFTDDIILDRNAPSVSSWSADYTTTTRISITATDDLSGLGNIDVSGPGGEQTVTFGDGVIDVPNALLTSSDGRRSGRFRVSDTVGNTTAWTDITSAIAIPIVDDEGGSGDEDTAGGTDSGIGSDQETNTQDDTPPSDIPVPDAAELAALPQLSVTDLLGDRGDTPVAPGEQIRVEFRAGTFTPLEWVSLSLHSDPVRLLTARAGLDGSLTATISVPGTVPAGTHTLAAVGQTSRRGATAPVEIAPPRSFVALTPARLLDTRSSTPVGRPDGTGAAITLDLAGRGGLPTRDIGAVALNVTVVNGIANDFGGYVTVYPCGVKPDASNLNFVSGQTVANSVVAPVSAAGTVCFYVYGTAHLLADVSGYFPTGFTAMTPTRVLDTRPTGEAVGRLDGTGTAVTLQIAGTAGVPETGVAAVAMNVTVVDGRANDFGGFVTVFPCGTRPEASNLNFTSGQTVPNSVIAPLSADGTVCLYVYGTAHLLADVSGYFSTGFSPVTPDRILDTRSGAVVGSLAGTAEARVVQVAGRGGVPASGAIAVALNVTVVDGRANDFGGFVTVYPCGSRPEASNLNFTSGQTVPNSVIAPLSADGTVCLYVYGTAHLLVDVSGHL